MDIVCAWSLGGREVLLEDVFGVLGGVDVLPHLDLGVDELPRQVVVLRVEAHVVAEQLLVLPLQPHHRVLPGPLRRLDARPLLLVLVQPLQLDVHGNLHQVLGVVLAPIPLRYVHSEVLHEALEVERQEVLSRHLQNS